MFLRGTQRLHFQTKFCILLTLWDLRLGHLSLSLLSHVGGGFGMENMSFEDLDLLLGVIEIHVVLHILVHGHKFSVL
jgi:hypothetical protein